MEQCPPVAGAWLLELHGHHGGCSLPCLELLLPQGPGPAVESLAAVALLGAVLDPIWVLTSHGVGKMWQHNVHW